MNGLFFMRCHELYAALEAARAMGATSTALRIKQELCNRRQDQPNLHVNQSVHIEVHA